MYQSSQGRRPFGGRLLLLSWLLTLLAPFRDGGAQAFIRPLYGVGSHQEGSQLCRQGRRDLTVIRSDPGGEFVRSGAGSGRENITGRTPSSRRPVMPPLKESMALLFSQEKREVDQKREEFRNLIARMLASPPEDVVPEVAKNVRFFLSTNTSIFMQEMLEELDGRDATERISLGSLEVTIEHQKQALQNLFTLILDFIELFVQHTRGEMRTHQAVLKEIIEAAKNKTAAELDQTIRDLRPYYREDFLTFLRSEYARVAKPPMSDDAMVLANLLQAIEGRVLAEVEDMMGAEAGLVSRLMSFTDEGQLSTALRGSFLSGKVKPKQFLKMLEDVLEDLSDRLPGPLESSEEATKMRDIHAKLRSVASFTRDFLTSSDWSQREGVEGE